MDRSKESKPTPLSDAIRGYLRKAGLMRRIGQAAVVEQWSDLVGPQIAKVTAAESVSPDGVLRVRVATPAWASELSLMTPQILARVNAARTGRITGIRWIAGGGGR
ncbi:MAG TPA: DUF721 domain-containing protein [Gemmatimonadales bacterium]|jgi:predicted nucleic acid-binding Zn ribbon protein